MTRARLFVFATTVGVTAATIACPSGGGGGNIAQPYGVPPHPQPTLEDAGQNPAPSVSEGAGAIPPPATIDPPPSTTAQPAPTLPTTAPTSKPKPYPTPGPPVALYGMPPSPQ